MQSPLPASPRRLAFVVPRYGADITGGAESLCRLVAEDLALAGHRVEVFTTCAVDHFTWADHHPPGTTESEGVTVHRFPVDPGRDNDLFFGLHHRIALEGRVPYIDELRWMSSSVHSLELEAALLARDDLDCIFALPYLFGTTHAVVTTRPDRVVLIPCLHDEPYAHTKVVRDMLLAARGCLANAAGEAQLLARIAPGAAVTLGGVGFAPPDVPPDPEAFCSSRGIKPGYLLYAGRREEAKGVKDLLTHYGRFRSEYPAAPPLALMGSGDLEPPADVAPHVIDLGFVPDDEKAAAFAAASVLLHPSRLESFGMVLLEAWISGTPALVNADSAVLVDHARASGGGLWYRGYAEFREALAQILDDDLLRDQLAARGEHYVRSDHSWSAVRARYLAAVDAWA